MSRTINGITVHGNAKDIRGKVFGRLTVVSLVDKRRSKLHWLCQCECGTTTVVSSDNLGGSHTQSCGCWKRERISETCHTKPMSRTINGLLVSDRVQDLTGRAFGRWKVCKLAYRAHKQLVWSCECQCGVRKEVYGCSLTSGKTQSCGCLGSDRAKIRMTTHGMTNSSEYNTWCLMKRRCTCPSDPCYPRYGGRGITVCQRWMESFTHFYDDMGLKPSPQHTIERVNNNLGYEPSNCKWDLPYNQVRNRRSNVLVDVNGTAMIVVDAADLLGISAKLVYSRIRRGWSTVRAITEPKHVN